MRESDIESHFFAEAKKLGALFHKWTGARGCPDRILIYKKRIYFIELKAPNGDLRPWQKRFHKKLKEQGFHVYVIWSKEQVNDFLIVLSTRISRPDVTDHAQRKPWTPHGHGAGQDRSDSGSNIKVIRFRGDHGGVDSRATTRRINNMARRDKEMAMHAPPESFEDPGE